MAAGEAFDIALLAADLVVIRGLVRTFFSEIKTEDWERPTDSRANGWTLRQAFCHIVAVAELLDESFERALDSERVFSPPLKNRQELVTFNQAQIDLRHDLPAEYLLQSFLEALSRTESRLAHLSGSDLERPVPLNAYNRPLSLAVLTGNQMTHPSLVHGAQLANGIGVEPLWRHFSADFMERQLTRFFHVFSHSYWPERGGDLTAVINFNIRGSGGGHWHVKLDKEGGAAGEGLADRPSLTMHFPDPDAFCSLFTFQLGPIRGVLTRKLFAWGNIPLAFRLSRLFTPT